MLLDFFLKCLNLKIVDLEESLKKKTLLENKAPTSCFTIPHIYMKNNNKAEEIRKIYLCLT